MIATRRDFVRLGLESCTLLSCGATAPGFLAYAAANMPTGNRSTGHVLVVLELNGGNDGLNTVVPYADDAYARHRPRLKLPTGSLHKLDDHVGLHPELFGLNDLWKRGELAIAQSVGYPNFNRSHFESMDIWHTAMLEPTPEASGWLNRGVGGQEGGGGGVAIHVGDGEVPRPLTGDALGVHSLEGLDQLVRRIGMPEQADTKNHRATLDRIARMPRGEAGSHLQFIQRSQVVTYASSAQIEEIIRSSNPQSDGGYPDTQLARRLRLVSQLIQAGLSTSIYYVQLEGFDTHVGQLDVHATLLREMGTAINAFFDDLRQSKEAGRVLLLAFSEFGRRLSENGSLGTDHGTAAPVFLMGQKVNGGLHGPYPNLINLEDGDIRFAIDFRRVYATILDRWLDCASRPVLGAEFEHLELTPSV